MNIALSWTDACFLSVLLLSLIGILRSVRKPHIREAFQIIFKRRVAISAFIVLMCFLVIGILDSLHIKTSQWTSNASVLDHLLSPLNEQYEQTYSAPCALTLYTKQMVLKGGHVNQVYPKLNYPANYFQTITERNAFIWHVIYQVTIWSGLITLLLGFVLRKKKQLLTILITSFVCLWLIGVCYGVSRELHLLGTGQIGQDIFYYTIKSVRTGLVIGILTTLFMMPLALFAGIAAGYFGGLVDDVIQYIYTTLSSIPGVLLITASVLSMQTYIVNHPEHFATLAQSADARLLALCAILGVTSWTSLCRLLRAETLKLREIDFILAAQALGTRSFKIMAKHILPNVMHIVIITIVLDFSFLVLAEAVLSYVGVGVSPMTISWGNMINSARLELAREPLVWWPMMAAFIFMFALVLACNLFADAVRDAFDPRR